MSRSSKRAKPIKLSRFETLDRATGLVVKDRDAEKLAEDSKAMTATSERLLHAHSSFTGHDRTQRITEAPIEIMHSKKLLDRDPDRNRILYEVACRYRQCWHAAGLNSLGAMDMGRVSAGGGEPAYMMPTSEYAAQQRSEIRAMRTVLGEYLDKWVVAIVIEERTAHDAGKMFTKRMDRETSSAISLEILRGALTTMANYWGMLGRS